MTTGRGPLHAVVPPGDEPEDTESSRAPEQVLDRWLDQHGPRRDTARHEATATGDTPPVDPLEVARHAQQAEPGPAAQPAEEATEQPEQEPEALPDHLEHRGSELPRVVLGVLFVAAVVAAVVALFWAASVASLTGLAATGVLALAAGMIWWALLEWAPTIVSLSQGQLEVARGERARRFDLRDPGTRVELGPDPRSLTWRAVVSRPGEPPVVIRRQHVKAAQFCRVVRSLRP